MRFGLLLAALKERQADARPLGNPDHWRASFAGIAAIRCLRQCTLALIFLAGTTGDAACATLEQPMIHQGMCDASAAAALNEDLFVVGDDEDNALRVYSHRASGQPLFSIDVSAFLGLRRGAEVDIEACARLGERIYWLSSHGTNVRGKKRLSRQRFFATTGSVDSSGFDLQPFGRPYLNLLQDLLRQPKLASFGLAAAANRPPKTPGALSIEGLAATPDGSLLIGFRNPIPGGRALLVPLLNPNELVEGRPARFGDPVLLNLGGLGIRSIELVGDRYLIIGGTSDGKGDSWIYEWDGLSPSARRVDDIRFGAINPEAVTVCRQDGPEVELLVVSDDGTVKMGTTECKKLKDRNQRQFRSVVLRLLQTPLP